MLPVCFHYEQASWREWISLYAAGKFMRWNYFFMPLSIQLSAGCICSPSLSLGGLSPCPAYWSVTKRNGMLHHNIFISQGNKKCHEFKNFSLVIYLSWAFYVFPWLNLLKFDCWFVLVYILMLLYIFINDWTSSPVFFFVWIHYFPVRTRACSPQSCTLLLNNLLFCIQ